MASCASLAIVRKLSETFWAYAARPHDLPYCWLPGDVSRKLRRGLSGVYSWMLEYLQRMAAEKKVELALGWARCFEEYVLQRFRHPNE